MTASEQEVFDHVEKYGCHVVSVFGGENLQKEPPFTYSIGLFKNFQLPEIIIIGLKTELAHVLINNICYDYKKGKSLKLGAFNSDILDHFDCMVVEVDKKFYPDYFGWARWFYKNDDFPVAQIIYPTVKGVFPWEKDFPANVQYPILNTDKN